MRQKEITIIAAEASPYAHVGMLGTTVEKLSMALTEAGHRVRLILPRYSHVDKAAYGLELFGSPIKVSTAFEERWAALYRASKSHEPDIEVYFIEHDLFFDRPEIYGPPGEGYFDNCHRFSFFSHAALLALKQLNQKVEVIHLFDWHTALVPALLKSYYAEEPVFKDTGTLLTLCSFRHKGVFPKELTPYTGLGWEAFNDDNLKMNESISLLKSGILYADGITTVSRGYAEWIETYNEDKPLVGEIEKKKVRGITNGYSALSLMEKRDILPATFTPQDQIGKEICKSSLLRLFGFSLDSNEPLISVKLSIDEKINIHVPEILGTLCKEGSGRYIAIGRTDRDTWNRLEYLHTLFPEQFGLYFGEHGLLEEQIAAGSDISLSFGQDLPFDDSLCRDLQYGTIPILSSTGCGSDLVTDFNKKQSVANGFFWEEMTPAAMLEKISLVLALYKKNDSWPFLIRNAMETNPTWKSCAKMYSTLYDSL